MNRRIVTIALLCLVCSIVVGYKIKVLGYHPRMVIPVFGYRLLLDMHLDGHGNPVSVTTFVPRSTPMQRISDLQVRSGPFAHATHTDGDNTVASWNADNVTGSVELSMSYLVHNKAVRFRLPDSLSIPTSYGPHYVSFLQATDLIQKDHPEIAALARRLGIHARENAVDITRTAFHYAADSLGSARFSARTDALLALKLREASCNGKSRLMVALLRHRGIPSRLVGGIILETGRKRTTHQWVEARLGDRWVPFCPLNGYFAELPDTYLAVYRGDESMFVRTANVNFKYGFHIRRVMLPRHNRDAVTQASLLNILNLWEMFSRAGIPLELLRILLMIPLGAVVIIIFRNVIGVHTFGTFLPVLIATAYRDTGLLWGHLVFVVVIGVGVLVRLLLDRYRLLHSPKLTIILVSVIVTLILLTVAGIKTGLRSLFGASMFPLAIMAITIERFGIVSEMRGLRHALVVCFWTIVVVTFCYLSMLSIFLQSIVLTFPETLLLIVAASMYLGSWNNLRLSEFIRFRRLIFGKRGGARVDN